MPLLKGLLFHLLPPQIQRFLPFEYWRNADYLSRLRGTYNITDELYCNALTILYTSCKSNSNLIIPSNRAKNRKRVTNANFKSIRHIPIAEVLVG